MLLQTSMYNSNIGLDIEFYNCNHHHRHRAVSIIILSVYISHFATVINVKIKLVSPFLFAFIALSHTHAQNFPYFIFLLRSFVRF